MTGPAGATGPAGSPAGIHGDGSDGALTVSTSENWSTSPPAGTFQFGSFTVAASQTLTVPSGLTIRVAGDVIIAGAIVVGASPFVNVAGGIPHLGVCSTVVPLTASGIANGAGGTAVNEAVARLLVSPDFSGGGNGAGLAGVHGFGGGYGGLRLRHDPVAAQARSANGGGVNGLPAFGGGVPGAW